MAMGSEIVGNGSEHLLHRFFKELAILLGLTLLVALALTLLITTSLRDNIIFSVSIGVSIFLLVWGASLLRHEQRKAASDFIIAVPVGGVLGVVIASYLIGTSPTQLLEQNPQLLIMAAVSSVTFGSAISYYFYARSRLSEHARQLQHESLQRARNEQRMTETELRLLQVQIEPHFLFNTLSNILGLIDDEPTSAKRMLESLTQYLRGSLQSTRGETIKLSQELDLLRAYLSIQTIRMGDRLDYSFDVPGDLEAITLPPLLIQPLVENAVRHGLEPKIEGGILTVRIRRHNDLLTIDVIDTGRGLQMPLGSGVGLKNVQQRIAALYGERGSFTLNENSPSGVTATLSLPIEGEALI
jgi:sensor histidine kinase YesM